MHYTLFSFDTISVNVDNHLFFHNHNEYDGFALTVDLLCI